MMKRSSHGICTVLLSVFVICVLLIPFVTAELVTETVQTIGLSCARPTHPISQFFCGLPKNQTVPDGPPYTVECYDWSESAEPIILWKWDFGTGSTTIGPSAQHSYITHGRHAISLTVSTACGPTYADTATHYITTYCSVPVPNFTTSVVEGIAPLTVNITDNATHTAAGLTQWTYWFDNEHSSSEQNPSFTYTGPGNYTINQTVRKTCMDPDASVLPAATRQVVVYPQGSYYMTLTPVTTTTSPAPTPLPTTNQTTANQTTANQTTTNQTTAASAPEVTANITPTATTEAPPVLPDVTGMGSLSAATEPSGAQVYVDNIPRGTTPATIKGIPAGTHTVRFELAGYQNMTVPVIINSGGTTEFAAKLMQEPRSSGIAIGPVIALAVIVLGILGGGIYMYLRHRAYSD